MRGTNGCADCGRLNGAAARFSRRSPTRRRRPSAVGDDRARERTDEAQKSERDAFLRRIGERPPLPLGLEGKVSRFELYAKPDEGPVAKGESVDKR